MPPAVKTPADDALDFAPGLLSIQESPPAKLPRTVLYCVAALFGILLTWAAFGRLDIVASADGRLVPQTYVKIVQPAEAGIVQQILVREGQSVDAEQILMRLDAKLTEADARTIRNEHELKRVQLRRIDAELAGLPMNTDAADSPEIYAQVASQYAAHRQAYQDALSQEQATLAKTRHDLRAAEELASKLRETLPTYRKSAAAFQQLGKDGFYSQLAVEEKQRDRIEREQDWRAQEATVASLQSTIAASEKNWLRSLQTIAANYRTSASKPNRNSANCGTNSKRSSTRADCCPYGHPSVV